MFGFLKTLLPGAMNIGKQILGQAIPAVLGTFAQNIGETLGGGLRAPTAGQVQTNDSPTMGQVNPERQNPTMGHTAMSEPITMNDMRNMMSNIKQDILYQAKQQGQQLLNQGIDRVQKRANDYIDNQQEFMPRKRRQYEQE